MGIFILALSPRCIWTVPYGKAAENMMLRGGRAVPAGGAAGLGTVRTARARVPGWGGFFIFFENRFLSLVFHGDFSALSDSYLCIAIQTGKRSDRVETREQLNALFVGALAQHRASMYHTAYAILRSSADAEDAVSAATEGCYRALRRIRSWDAIKAYLIKATIHASYGILRKRKHETAADLDVVLATVQRAEDVPIWMYTQRLPTHMRIVLQLRYGEDMPLKEIARMLGVTKGTVSSRLSRAQEQVRQWLEQEGR